MSSYREMLEADLSRVRPPEFDLDGLIRVRDRKRRNRRIGAMAVAIGLFVAVAGAFAVSVILRTEVPATPPPTPTAPHHNGVIAVSRDISQDGRFVRSTVMTVD